MTHHAMTPRRQLLKDITGPWVFRVLVFVIYLAFVGVLGAALVGAGHQLIGLLVIQGGIVAAGIAVALWAEGNTHEYNYSRHSREGARRSL